MATRIPAGVEADIRQMVESGRFADADSVLREALRLLQDDERKKQLLHAEPQIGLDPGPTSSQSVMRNKWKNTSSIAG
ncbi:MAG: Bacterial antitoxin of ParD toxin-antitoxin type system [Thermomicrobiales bacterium]|jgi:putative addiction module CopG family antidote|nr:Bacterial antitoxin of ParD toxin-antitoxin type system [Thermomicrobiales bacterium]